MVIAHPFQQQKENVAGTHSVSKPTDHASLLAEFTSSLSSAKTDVQNMTIPSVWLFIFLQFCCTEDVDTSSHTKICQLMSCDNSNGITFKQGHCPSKKTERGRARAREGHVGCTVPTRTHSSPCSHWLFLLVRTSAQTGVCIDQGQVLPVLVVQLCTGQWVGPSVGFAWQG